MRNIRRYQTRTGPSKLAEIALALGNSLARQRVPSMRRILKENRVVGNLLGLVRLRDAPAFLQRFVLVLLLAPEPGHGLLCSRNSEQLWHQPNG